MPPGKARQDRLGGRLELERKGQHFAGKRMGTMALAIAAFCILPSLAVFLAAFSGGTDTLSHLAETVLHHHEICHLACGSHNVRSVCAVIELASALQVPAER